MSPQAQLGDFEYPDLTDAEREVYQAVVDGPFGVREYARQTDRSPGTLGNLLRRARNKRGDEA